MFKSSNVSHTFSKTHVFLSFFHQALHKTNRILRRTGTVVLVVTLALAGGCAVFWLFLLSIGAV